jgi:hypothetical protein
VKTLGKCAFILWLKLGIGSCNLITASYTNYTVSWSRDSLDIHSSISVSSSSSPSNRPVWRWASSAAPNLFYWFLTIRMSLKRAHISSMSVVSTGRPSTVTLVLVRLRIAANCSYSIEVKWLISWLKTGLCSWRWTWCSWLCRALFYTASEWSIIPSTSK